MYTTIIYETSNVTSLGQAINTELLKRFTPTNHLQCLEINSHTIKPCNGCFGCWFKSPGQCILNNAMITKTTSAFVQSDLLLIVSPIYYGCYGAPMKTLFDHTIANVLPFFTTYKNEVHHVHRYKKLANQIIIAYGDDLLPEEKETFLALTKANATNYCIDDPKVYFCTCETDIEALFNELEPLIKK